MKKLYFFFVLFPFCLTAQHYSFPGATTGSVPPIRGDFFAFAVELTADQAEGVPENVPFYLRNNRDAHSFTLYRDTHNPEKWISQLQFGDPRFTSWTLELTTGYTATLHLYDPGPSSARTEPSKILASETCVIPAVVERTGWCPAGNCNPVNPPAATEVTHLIIHHSVSTNTSSDWAALVRSIWSSHVNFNGWDDVGYNYLIDPDGLIYEGRGSDTRGAHFCGDNTGTMGVCLLGTFTNQAPTATALRALEQLLAWKASNRSIDPEAVSFHAAGDQQLNHIAGHRQGCPTECPGSSFFPLFGQLRANVADTIAACATVNTDDYAANEQLTVSPNPSQGNVHILGLKRTARISIINANGQLISSRTLLPGDFIEASTFPTAGLYRLIIATDGKRYVKNVFHW
ncbi:MAG: N-acetylmuramoyl-L-alanine amidase [Bacteroidota bacterium]